MKKKSETEGESIKQEKETSTNLNWSTKLLFFFKSQNHPQLFILNFIKALASSALKFVWGTQALA